MTTGSPDLAEPVRLELEAHVPFMSVTQAGFVRTTTFWGSSFEIAAALLVTFHPDDPSIARTDCPQTERRAKRELAPAQAKYLTGR